jgi:flagellar hook-associated protein 1 FlgK
MKSLVATLGIDSQQADNYSDNQQIVVNQIINRRLSNSGVSIDEEMANLVKFQHAYNAAAKMIQTMSEIYETLINKLFV